jgi:hypothetical protein
MNTPTLAHSEVNCLVGADLPECYTEILIGNLGGMGGFGETLDEKDFWFTLKSAAVPPEDIPVWLTITTNPPMI